MANLEQLVDRYQRFADQDALAQLLQDLAPLVKQIANRYRYRGETFDDLVQVGYIGLIKAATRFEPARKLKFITLANHFIRGEMTHHLRDNAPVIRPPRPSQFDPFPKRYKMVSINHPITEDGLTVEDILGGTDDNLVRAEYKADFVKLLQRLPPLRRQALLLYCMGDLSQMQVANMLGYSQKHISRMWHKFIREAATNGNSRKKRKSKQR